MGKRSGKRPNVDRMRRVVARDEGYRAERDFRAWLASLTPEHRKRHEVGSFCSECIHASVAAAARSFTDGMTRLHTPKGEAAR